MGMLTNPQDVFPLTSSSFPSAPIPENFGKRPDGSEKGLGWYGKLPYASGGVATELSADSIIDGKQVYYPLLVPGLTPEEMKHLLSGGKPTNAIYDKAEQHAKWRLKQGKSPFAQSGEQFYALPK